MTARGLTCNFACSLTLVPSSPRLTNQSFLRYLSQQRPCPPTANSPTPFEWGAFLPNGHRTDPPLPEDDPTIGYKLNHFMLRIRDPVRSLHFYIELMGMRTVFTTNVGPFTIYYLGYPTTATHRADLAPFGLDTAISLQHTLGLLELHHVHGSEKQTEGYYATGNDPLRGGLGFGHLGFTVPDVPAALARLQAAGVKVVKPLGVATRESIPISDWEIERGIGHGEIHDNCKAVFDKIAFVQDPVSGPSASFMIISSSSHGITTRPSADACVALGWLYRGACASISGPIGFLMDEKIRLRNRR